MDHGSNRKLAPRLLGNEKKDSKQPLETKTRPVSKCRNKSEPCSDLSGDQIHSFAETCAPRGASTEGAQRQKTPPEAFSSQSPEQVHDGGCVAV